MTGQAARTHASAGTRPTPSVRRVGGSADAAFQSSSEAALRERRAEMRAARSGEPQKAAASSAKGPVDRRSTLGTWTAASRAAAPPSSWARVRPPAHMSAAVDRWVNGGIAINDALDAGDLARLPNGLKASYNAIWRYWQDPLKADRDMLVYRVLRPDRRRDDVAVNAPVTPKERADIARWLEEDQRRMTATSVDPAQAVKWGQGAKDPFIAEILVPEGTPILPVGRGHEEIVLPPGSMTYRSRAHARTPDYLTVTDARQHPGAYTLVGVHRVRFRPAQTGLPGPVLPKSGPLAADYRAGRLTAADEAFLGLAGGADRGRVDWPSLPPASRRARARPGAITSREKKAGIRPPGPRPKARQPGARKRRR